jgi:hypothetical protein
VIFWVFKNKMMMLVVSIVIVMLMIFIFPLPNIIYSIFGDNSDDSAPLSQYYNVVNTARARVDMGYGFLGTVNIPQTVLQVKAAAPIIATEINIKTDEAVKAAILNMPDGATPTQVRSKIASVKTKTSRKVQMKRLIGKSGGLFKKKKKSSGGGSGKRGKKGGR